MTTRQAVRRVELWCFAYEAWDPSELLEHAWLMSAEERRRYALLHFERDRRLFLATRLLARGVLSSQVGRHPADVVFRRGSYGKPELVRASGQPPVCFNLSNTRGLAVLAVSVDGCAVGVDAEALDREVSLESLARCFTPEERATLQSERQATRTRRLLEHWTLKESYVKARGFGLSVEPELIAVERDAAGYRLNLSPALRDDGDAWRCAVLDASERHVIAVAARTAGAELEVTTRELERPYFYHRLRSMSREAPTPRVLSPPLCRAPLRRPGEPAPPTWICHPRGTSLRSESVNRWCEHDEVAGRAGAGASCCCAWCWRCSSWDVDRANAACLRARSTIGGRRSS